MKYNKILLFFGVGLVVSTVLRVLQLWFTIEDQTGFFNHDFNDFGIYILIIILLFTIATAVFCLISHRRPDHPPKSNPILSVCSLLLSVSLLVELFTEKFSDLVNGWQISFLKIFGFLTAAFFVYFAYKEKYGTKYLKYLIIIPSLYVVFRIIYNFSAISALAIISDNLIFTASYCAVLLFMISFAKLYNGVESETNFRKLMATGLSAGILCVSQPLAYLIYNAFTGFSYLHTSLMANISLLVFGFFILTFVFLHFSRENACNS
ncbi:MAG: hypothetical protein E7560_00130 [Ruminococcaceae bacterium]|nr:hypothetical protein [Oscillospiraceae bacterium]